VHVKNWRNRACRLSRCTTNVGGVALPSQSIKSFQKAPGRHVGRQAEGNGFDQDDFMRRWIARAKRLIRKSPAGPHGRTAPAPRDEAVGCWAAVRRVIHATWPCVRRPSLNVTISCHGERVSDLATGSVNLGTPEKTTLPVKSECCQIAPPSGQERVTGFTSRSVAHIQMDPNTEAPRPVSFSEHVTEK
jgi:hypothetical protein